MPSTKTLFRKAFIRLSEHDRLSLIKNDKFVEDWSHGKWDIMLCQVCRLLDKASMLTINDESFEGDNTLLAWYMKHLKWDYENNKHDPNHQEFAEQEIKRIG